MIFKQCILTFVGLFLVGSISIHNNYSSRRSFSSKDETIKLVRKPYLQTVLSDSVTIMWKTNRGQDCYIKYGKSPTKIDKKISGLTQDQHVNTMNEVTIERLEPHKKYYYQVYTDGHLLATGEDYYFVTAPLNDANSFSFFAMGDIGSGGGFQGVTAKQINDLKPKPDLGLLLGDIVYSRGESEKYDKLFFEPLSVILTNTPVYPVLGNHDWKSDPNKNFEQEWKLPNNEHYYSFEYGNALFVGLDSELADPDAGSSSINWRLQKKWLKATLAGSKDKYKWIIVYLHHNGRSCTYKDDNKYVMSLYPIFAHNDVDIVVNGHAHTYERLQPYDEDGNLIKRYTDNIHQYPSIVNGFISITSGAGGKAKSGWTPGGCKQQNIVASARLFGHFLLFKIYSNKLKMEAISSLTGHIRDEFIIEK